MMGMSIGALSGLKSISSLRPKRPKNKKDWKKARDHLAATGGGGLFSVMQRNKRKK